VVLDFIRIAGAAWLTAAAPASNYQGASSSHAGGAHLLVFTPDRLAAKALGAMISIELEQPYNKQQIFELYANEVTWQPRELWHPGILTGQVAYFGKD